METEIVEDAVQKTIEILSGVGDGSSVSIKFDPSAPLGKNVVFQVDWPNDFHVKTKLSSRVTCAELEATVWLAKRRYDIHVGRRKP